MNARVLILACFLVPPVVQEGEEPAPPDLFSVETAPVPPEPVVLPMRMRGTQPGVEVWANGEGPFFFAIDTGGQGLARADARLVRRLKLPQAGTVRGGDPSGRAEVEMAVVEIASLVVGEAEFTGVPALSRDYNTRARELPAIDGILGYHLFTPHVLTLNIAEKEARIERGPWKPPAGARVLELVNDPRSVPVVRGEIAGLAIDSLYIDTGKMGGLMLPPALVEKLPHAGEVAVVGQARTITGELEIKQVRIEGDLVVGDLVVEDPVVEFSDVMRVAILGSQTLSGQVLTVDAERRTAWIRTPAQERRLRAADPGDGEGEKR